MAPNLISSGHVKGADISERVSERVSNRGAIRKSMEQIVAMSKLC